MRNAVLVTHRKPSVQRRANQGCTAIRNPEPVEPVPNEAAASIPASCRPRRRWASLAAWPTRSADPRRVATANRVPLVDPPANRRDQPVIRGKAAKRPCHQRTVWVGHYSGHRRAQRRGRLPVDAGPASSAPACRKATAAVLNWAGWTDPKGRARIRFAQWLLSAHSLRGPLPVPPTIAGPYLDIPLDRID